MIPIPLKNIFGRLALAWHERAVALKAITFALVGVVNSAIDFGFFSAAYYYFGLSIIVSQLIAWTVAVSGSYVMNSKITFAAESGRKLGARTYFGFVLTQVAGCSSRSGLESCSRSAPASWSTSRCRISWYSGRAETNE
jgi:hypothetical protein